MILNFFKQKIFSFCIKLNKETTFTAAHNFVIHSEVTLKKEYQGKTSELKR
jgi:hypothetical protein